MKTMHVFRILSVLLMVFVTLAAASPTYADTHYHFVAPYVNTYTLWPAAENPCGFDIIKHNYGTSRGNFWLDDAGFLTKEIDTFGNMRLDYIVNDKIVNEQIQGPVMYALKYDFPANRAWVTWKMVGTVSLTTIPGYGIVRGGGIQWVGIDTFDITNLNDWKYLGTEMVKQVGGFVSGWAKVCAYLGS
jgi:hypothetical protein